MVRYLITDQQTYKSIVGPKPINILIIMANPSGYPELNVVAEATTVRNFLGKLKENGDAYDLLNLLRVSDVKVVFLGACLTSAFGASQAIMGIAPRLLWAGIPAVIAMQFAVPDRTATTFMGDLYRFLVAGEPLDVAVAKARLGTYFKGKDKIYWGIPTLFMRAPDGVLWQKN